MIKEYQERLETAFPVANDQGILRAVSEGLLLADSLIVDTPLLNTLVGMDMRGLIRRAGIMWRINDLSRVGDVAYEAMMVPMQRGRWHCLEIGSAPFKAHVCRTESAGAFPEESLTRQDERVLNPQIDLFEDDVAPVRGPEGSLYAYLTFGAGPGSQLGHLCWAMESKDGGDWVAFINVLMRLAASGGADEIPAEAPSKSTKVRFHEHIEEALTNPSRRSDAQ